MAAMAVDIDMNKYQGDAVQVRVVQNQEPAHFVQMFECLVIHDAELQQLPKMYHIRGTNPYNAKAVQVPCQAVNLNINDVFVILTEAKAYIWKGKGANAEEIEIGSKSLNKLNVNGLASEEIEEESTPAELWDILGGQCEYSNVKKLDVTNFEPRLFHCTNVLGSFKIQEIFNFSQEDLLEEDVMILDVYNTVFVWIGTESREDEKKNAIEAAHRFNQSSVDGRDPETSIVQVHSGKEPPFFTRYFPGWTEKQAYVDVYAEKLARLKEQQGEEEEQASQNVVQVQEEEKKEFVQPTNQTYTFEELKKFPEGVDPTKREQYLDDETFFQVFKMNKQEFAAQKVWKQKELKKKAGLF